MRIEKIIPAAAWLRNYTRADFRSDLSAGLLVGVMLIPQAMAYAMLAGLPPVVGLYASTVPLIVYALFGSSRALAVGPVAIVSLLVFVTCSQVAQPGTPAYMQAVLLLTLMAGALQLVLGVVRAGTLTNFVSHAVIVGFTAAAAIIICLSQLGHLLGIRTAAAHDALGMAAAVLRGIDGANPATLAAGALSVAMLFFMKKKYPRFPAPLALIAAGIAAVYFFKLDRLGIEIVGEIPRGLPPRSFPAIDIRGVTLLSGAAASVVFVGFMESISVARYIASRKRQKVDADRELNALGLADIASACFSGCPVTGGFSRTAVNDEAGARTGLASVITASVVLVSLLFLTPLFYYLPRVVLAAIIVVAVAGLIDVGAAVKLFRVKTSDGLVLLAAFLCTLAAGVEWGIFCGVAVSLLLFIRRSAYPRITELGYCEEEDTFRSIEFYPQAKTYPGTLVMRADTSLYFANMKFLEDWLRARLSERADVRRVVMDFSGVNDIDAVAVNDLEELAAALKETGVECVFAGMKHQVRDTLSRAGWQERHPAQTGFSTLKHALRDLAPLT